MASLGGIEHIAELETGVPEELVTDYLAKLHYVSESVARFEFASPNRDRVRFVLHADRGGDAGIVASRMAMIAKKMTRAFRPRSGKTLAKRDVAVPCREDPHPLLEASGDLHRYGSGRYGLGPRLVALVDFFDRRLAVLGNALGASEHRFPSLIGADALDRCRYLRAFPHSLTFVTHLREDVDAIDRFSHSARWEGSHLEHDGDVMSRSKCLLAPSVCFHYYAWLQDTVQENSAIVGAAGKCFRFESGNLRGLERLWDFTMREAIFLGTPEHVLEARARALEATTVLLDEWQLAYSIESATDPFFIEEFATQATFQLAFDLKFEIRARLPYTGGTLAAGSFNYHQDFFGRGFNITRASGEPVHTGCIGFGLERLALAFLSQYGLDRSQWPASVADGVGSW